MRILKIILALIMMFILPGCLSSSRIENTAIINTRGIDLVEQDGKRLIEATVIPYIFDPEAAETTSILIGRGDTIKQARREAEKQSPFPLSPGKINMDFYGKDAAEAGILPFLNTLVRDARVSDRMQIAITSTTAREFLEYKHKITTLNTTEYLQDLTNKEIDLNVLPRNTLEYFSRLIVQVGIDPTLPILTIKEDNPTVSGVALFKNDRLVGEISLMESFYINQLRKTVEEASIHVKVPTKNYKKEIAYSSDYTDAQDEIDLSLNLTKGKSKIHIEDFDNLSFKADVKMRVELLETSIPMDIKTEKVADKLERDIEEYIQQEYKKLFDKLQEVDSDALGLGRKYVATRKGSKTTDKEWREKYKNATIEFKVDVTIVHFGTID